jgi:hypothetical protein
MEAITRASQLPPRDFPILVLKEEMVSEEQRYSQYHQMQNGPHVMDRFGLYPQASVALS